MTNRILIWLSSVVSCLDSMMLTDSSLQFIASIGIRTFSHPDMVKRGREIARLFQQERIYDSLYAALADLRSCEFWTADILHAVYSEAPNNEPEA